MAIKMRVNNTTENVCRSCGIARKRSLDMFDVKIESNKQGVSSVMFTLCDVCMEEMFHKSLKATCHTSERVKQPRDMEIINSRFRKYAAGATK